MEIQKLDAEQNEPLTGAVFGLYAAEDMQNWKGKTVVKKGTLIATAETTVDETGEVQKAVFSPDLPLGQYYLKELKAPMGYTTTKERIEVDASYRDDQREVIEISEAFKNYPVQVQLNVMDYFTEEELDGATLQLVNEDGNSFTTVLTAHDKNPIIWGLEIGKTYTLQELVSPQGYHYNLYLKDDYVTKKPNAVELDKSYLGGQVSDKITFTIKDENKLQVVSVFNKPITGNVVIEKTGQVPTATEKGTDENGNVVNKPIYEIKGLPGAEYALIAKEDIVYPDGYTGTLFTAGDTVLDRYQELKATTLKNYTLEVPVGELADVSEYIGKVPDEDATQSDLYQFYQRNENRVQRSLLDGTAVHYVLRTNEDGKVQVTGLPLGEYEVVEVKAPTGYYRDQNNCTQPLSLVESEQSGRSEAIVAVDAIFQNEKQKAKVTVTKSDRDTGEKLQGAVIGLYTAEVLKNQAGEVIAEADTLLESVMTDTEGKAIFESDLPFGRYYVKELTAPEGYYLSDKMQCFTFAYAEDSTEMVEFTLQIQDEKKPEPAGQGGSGDSSNVVPLETPLTSDGNALELALLAITVVALIGIIVTVILKMKHVTPGGDEVKNTKV